MHNAWLLRLISYWNLLTLQNISTKYLILQDIFKLSERLNKQPPRPDTVHRSAKIVISISQATW
jgi:hypothetical protein